MARGMRSTLAHKYLSCYTSRHQRYQRYDDEMPTAREATTPLAPEVPRMEPDPPRIDLHRHLEGSIRPQTVLELAARRHLRLPRNLDRLRPLIQVTGSVPDLMSFIACIEVAASTLTDPEACARVAYECVEDARNEGIAYLELRFSPLFMSLSHHLDPAAVVEAVVDGASRGARDFGVRTNLIGILSRTYGPVAAMRELGALLAHRTVIVALDLAGDEARWPGERFLEHFRRGRDAGWRVTVHAGEAAGPKSVWQAIIELGAERIGHGLRAADDPLLLDYLAQRRVGIEMSLTSNVQTSSVQDYASHPLRAYLERGILATINTDDPAISGITLGHELAVAAPAAGLTPEQIRQAQENALAVAFLSDDEKAALRDQHARPTTEA
jgi:adenosine deaminase